MAVPRPIPPHDARSFFIPSANSVPSLTTAAAFPASTAFSNGAPMFYSLSPAPWNDAMSHFQWSYPSLVCQQGGAASRGYYVPQAAPNILLDAPWLRRPWQQAVFQGFQNGPTSLHPVGASPGVAPNQVWVGAPSYGHEYVSGTGRIACNSYSLSFFFQNFTKSGAIFRHCVKERRRKGLETWESY